MKKIILMISALLSASQLYASDTSPSGSRWKHLATDPSVPSSSQVPVSPPESMQQADKCDINNTFGSLQDLLELGHYFANNKQYKEAAKRYILVAKKGIPAAYYALGNLYAQESLDTPDDELGDSRIKKQKLNLTAMEWYTGAIKKGYDPDQIVNTMNKMGQIFQKKGDLENAKYWFKKAADNGNADAMNSLGYRLYLKQDLKDAQDWFEQAAKQGHAIAMYNLGSLLYLKQDLKGAKHWFEQAAKQGHADAMYSLVSLLQQEGDLEKVQYWVEQAANKGDIDAMNSLGRLYEQQGKIDDAIVQFKKAEAKEQIFSLIHLLYLASAHDNKFTTDELTGYANKFLTLKKANNPEVQKYQQKFSDRYNAALAIATTYAPQEEPIGIGESSLEATRTESEEEAESSAAASN